MKPLVERRDAFRRFSATDFPDFGPTFPKSDGVRELARELYEATRRARQAPVSIGVVADGEVVLLEARREVSVDGSGRSEVAVLARVLSGASPDDMLAAGTYALLAGNPSKGGLYLDADGIDEAVDACVAPALAWRELVLSGDRRRVSLSAGVPPTPHDVPESEWSRLWGCLTLRALLAAEATAPRLVFVSLVPDIEDAAFGRRELIWIDASADGLPQPANLLDLAARAAHHGVSIRNLWSGLGNPRERLANEVWALDALAKCVRTDVDGVRVDLCAAEQVLTETPLPNRAQLQARLSGAMNRVVGAVNGPWVAAAVDGTISAPSDGGRIRVVVGMDRATERVKRIDMFLPTCQPLLVAMGKLRSDADHVQVLARVPLAQWPMETVVAHLEQAGAPREDVLRRWRSAPRSDQKAIAESVVKLWSESPLEFCLSAGPDRLPPARAWVADLFATWPVEGVTPWLEPSADGEVVEPYAASLLDGPAGESWARAFVELWADREELDGSLAEAIARRLPDESVGALVRCAWAWRVPDEHVQVDLLGRWLVGARAAVAPALCAAVISAFRDGTAGGMHDLPSHIRPRNQRDATLLFLWGLLGRSSEYNALGGRVPADLWEEIGRVFGQDFVLQAVRVLWMETTEALPAVTVPAETWQRWEVDAIRVGKRPTNRMGEAASHTDTVWLWTDALQTFANCSGPQAHQALERLRDDWPKYRDRPKDWRLLWQVGALSAPSWKAVWGWENFGGGYLGADAGLHALPWALRVPLVSMGRPNAGIGLDAPDADDPAVFAFDGGSGGLSSSGGVAPLWPLTARDGTELRIPLSRFSTDLQRLVQALWESSENAIEIVAQLGLTPALVRRPKGRWSWVGAGPDSPTLTHSPTLYLAGRHAPIPSRVLGSLDSGSERDAINRLRTQAGQVLPPPDLSSKQGPAGGVELPRWIRVTIAVSATLVIIALGLWGGAWYFEYLPPGYGLSFGSDVRIPPKEKATDDAGPTGTPEASGGTDGDRWGDAAGAHGPNADVPAPEAGGGSINRTKLVPGAEPNGRVAPVRSSAPAGKKKK